jgi:hypothetical protein
MNFKMTKIAAVLAISGFASISAYAVPTVMVATGGNFQMGKFTPPGGINFGVGSGAADITDQYDSPGWDVNVAQANGVAAPGAIATFQFGTNPGSQVNTFTSMVDPQHVDAGGHAIPVFSGTLTNGTQTFDISSFYANWNRTDFNQGSTAASLNLSGCGTSGSTTMCNYSLAWSSKIMGGPFNGNTGKWILNGTISTTVAAVPEASTYGMMIAGLGLVGFVARRRKNMMSK